MHNQEHQFRSDSAVEKISSRPLFAPGQDTAFCDTLAHFREALLRQVAQWSEKTDDETLFVALDGISGTGKTSLRETFAEIVDSIGGLLLHVISMDYFIRTDRDSPLRSLMLHNPRLFWELLYSRRAIIKILHEIRRQGENGFVKRRNGYDRNTGKIMASSLFVPSGRKVVLVDGLNSTCIVEEFARATQASILRVMVYVKPETALRRAVIRDAQQGRRTSETAYKTRAREFGYQIPQIHGQNITQADILFLNS